LKLLGVFGFKLLMGFSPFSGARGILIRCGRDSQEQSHGYDKE
jgi:hypothetical protein